eukprot:CAMPEP_0202427422 /NCGR_PEP_ID=MMETSP1345-20130828/1649_1 /ASSEMBLY_ACC=CAM_ASM_000843 /TAXON_ID=342563 /ORGANISM="Fabrea Fabrea salina" /LENGTH=87 /DNA_ID=CAMNT_0049038131 /DNA_START=669 /DNA_END=932 /DNA_ORIENTATION=-
MVVNKGVKSIQGAEKVALVFLSPTQKKSCDKNTPITPEETASAMCLALQSRKIWRGFFRMNTLNNIKTDAPVSAIISKNTKSKFKFP